MIQKQDSIGFGPSSRGAMERGMESSPDMAAFQNVRTAAAALVGCLHFYWQPQASQ